jgi:hypothetical protein
MTTPALLAASYLRIIAREYDAFVHTNGANVILSRSIGTEFTDYITLHCSSAGEARECCKIIIEAFA